jgi:hypothetical protein
LKALKILKLDKVGTFAKIIINEVAIAELDNLYLTHYVEMSDSNLAIGNNTI